MFSWLACKIIQNKERKQSSQKEHFVFKAKVFLWYASTEDKSCALERNKDETDMC